MGPWGLKLHLHDLWRLQVCLFHLRLLRQVSNLSMALAKRPNDMKLPRFHGSVGLKQKTPRNPWWNLFFWIFTVQRSGQSWKQWLDQTISSRICHFRQQDSSRKMWSWQVTKLSYKEHYNSNILYSIIRHPSSIIHWNGRCGADVVQNFQNWQCFQDLIQFFFTKPSEARRASLWDELHEITH